MMRLLGVLSVAGAAEAVMNAGGVPCKPMTCAYVVAAVSALGVVLRGLGQGGVRECVGGIGAVWLAALTVRCVCVCSCLGLCVNRHDQQPEP